MSDRTKDDRTSSLSMADINLIISAMISRDRQVRLKGSKAVKEKMDRTIYI